MIYKLVSVCHLDNGTGGNQAGVCLLPNNEKQKLATKINVSETCFVENIENYDDKTNIKIAYYTPTNQVSFCGHGTIATLGYCIRSGLITNKKINVVLENSQIVECFVDKKCILIKSGKYDCEEISIDISRCFQNFSIKFKLFVIRQTSNDLFIELNSTKELYALSPNFDEITRVSKLLGVSGFHCYVLGNTIYTRNFSPLDGINEESVTISATLGLALFLRQLGILKFGITQVIQGSNIVNYGDIKILQDESIYVGGNYKLN